MPQTTKTSTNGTKRTAKNLKSPLDGELGVNEPYLNPEPDFPTMMMRVDRKCYKFDAEGTAYRFYPPGLKKLRTKAEPKS